MVHSAAIEEMRKVKPTAPKPYFFRKVIRNPKPMKIITAISSA